MSIRTIGCGILLASGFFVYEAANAQGQHPHCVQALSDISAARGVLLQLIDGKPMTHNEKEALRQINVMIREINDAAPGNGKVDDYPHAAHVGDDAARIQQCVDYLKKAKDDLSHEEDSRFAGGLRDRSIKNCDEAIRFVARARHR